MAVTKRGNGYLISVYLGRDGSGKKDYHYETFYAPTKSLAKDREIELKKQFRHRKYGPARDVQTVGDLLHYWHKTATDLQQAGEKTLKIYSWHIERLEPVVGHLNLYDLTAWDIQQAMSGQFLDVSDRTRKNFFTTLKTALKQGYGWGLLATDVTAGIKLPKVTPKDKPILSLQELYAMLESAKGYKHHLIIRMLIVTGARLGEILGLRWSDVDFATGVIKIQKSVDSHKREVKDRVKTKSSRRSTKLDAETLGYLKQFRQQQAVIAINKDERLVFLADDGRPMRHRAVELTFKRTLKKAGLPEMGIHRIRHSVLSGLYDLGIPVADIIALSGHANIQSLEDYIHSFKVGLNLLDSVEKVADK